MNAGPSAEQSRVRAGPVERQTPRVERSASRAPAAGGVQRAPFLRDRGQLGADIGPAGDMQMAKALAQRGQRIARRIAAIQYRRRPAGVPWAQVRRTGIRQTGDRAVERRPIADAQVSCCVRRAPKLGIGARGRSRLHGDPGQPQIGDDTGEARTVRHRNPDGLAPPFGCGGQRLEPLHGVGFQDLRIGEAGVGEIRAVDAQKMLAVDRRSARRKSAALPFRVFPSRRS